MRVACACASVGTTWCSQVRGSRHPGPRSGPRHSTRRRPTRASRPNTTVRAARWSSEEPSEGAAPLTAASSAGMTLETCGREASQENASSSMVWPRACTKACSFSTMSSLFALWPRSFSRPSCRDPGIRRPLTPRWYLPVSRPLASGKNGRSPSRIPGPPAAAPFRLAHEQAVFVLGRDEGVDPSVRAIQWASRPATPESWSSRYSAPCPAGPGRRARASVSSIGVSGSGSCMLVEVDPVGLQPPQAGLDRGHDVAPRGALLAAVVVHRLAELGRQHDVLAAVAEHLAEHGFGAAQPP